MSLPAVITLTQAGLTPALELVDGAIQPPVQPEYMSWLANETTARVAGDAANIAAISAEVTRARAAEVALTSQVSANAETTAANTAALTIANAQIAVLQKLMNYVPGYDFSDPRNAIYS